MGMHFLKTVRRSLEETDSWPRGVPPLIRFARALWSSEPFMTMVEVKSGMRLAHGAALGDGVDNLNVRRCCACTIFGMQPTGGKGNKSL